jgi:HEPN domain-containing protein
MSGLELPADWVEKADVFLVNAERHLGEGVYWLALIVALTGSHPYTHDLTELVDVLAGLSFKVPEEVTVASELLTPHYTLSRYPGRRSLRYTASRGRRCVGSAKTIVGWVKSVAGGAKS